MSGPEAIEIGRAILKNKFADIIRDKLYLFANLGTSAKAETKTVNMTTEEITQGGKA